MQSFFYERAANVAHAISASQQPGAILIAGGTELTNWMKEAIVQPDRLVDLNRIAGLDGIEIDQRRLTIGALTRMTAAAEHEAVRENYPVLSEALLKSASPQIRNMATMGGNLMQRTRCPYFRAEVELPCNKRRAGSGCSALVGEDRFAAIFGWSERCVATHPSDAAVALMALDAVVYVEGPSGPRAISLQDFYRPPQETNLEPGEIITSIVVPPSAAARRSHYVKVRERTSYEFALVSAAACMHVEDGRIKQAQVALGGVAAMPWRLNASERALVGVAPSDTVALRRAIDSGFVDARPLRHNGFKVELAKRAAIRALQIAGSVA